MSAPRRAPALVAILALLFTVTPSFAFSLGQAPDDGISLWRVGGALLLCLFLAVLGAFALQSRWGFLGVLPLAPQSQRRLRLVESLRLSPQAQLLIVACDGKELLVLTSPDQARLVTPLDPPAKIARPDAS